MLYRTPQIKYMTESDNNNIYYGIKYITVLSIVYWPNKNKWLLKYSYQQYIFMLNKSKFLHMDYTFIDVYKLHTGPVPHKH